MVDPPGGFLQLPTLQFAEIMVYYAYKKRKE